MKISLGTFKRSVLSCSLALLSFGAHAQSVDEGIKMVRYERYSKAKEILTPLAAGNALANYYLGLAALGQEDLNAAAQIFSKYPDDAANTAGLARVAFEKGNAADGMRLATAAAAMGKKKDAEPTRYAADAITYSNGGDVQQAITWYNTSLSRNDNPSTRISLGDAYRKLSTGGGQAMSSWEKVSGADAKNSLAFSRIGSLWYDARQYDRALENYQKAKDADPQNPLPYRDLANAYFYSGKYELAKQNIEEYLKLSDNSCADKIQHANLLFLTKDYAQAAAEMRQNIASCGERPYMYRIIGYSEYESKNYSEALSNMRTFFTKQPSDKLLPKDFIYMGRAYLQTGRPDSADAYFTRAVSLDTSADKAKLLREIADDYKGLKNDTAYAKAGTYYGRIVAANAKTPALDYYYWGFYNFYGKKYDEAARAFEAMENTYPDQPSATYWRGRVAAATDPEAKSGVAAPYFTKWLEFPADKYGTKGGPSNNDKTVAYRYLAIYAYNKDDKAKLQDYMGKLEAIDPKDPILLQLKGAMAKPGKK